MMQRIRLRGKSIGQIDDALLEQYKMIEPYKKLTIIIEVIIGREILHYTVTGIKDLDLAESYVQNLKYRNIGEYLEAYMRDRLMDSFEICQNCDSYDNGMCKEKNISVNPLEKSCK